MAGIRMPVLLSLCLLLSACATTLPRHHDTPPSTAFDRPQDTTLGRFFEPELAAHPGKSGVAIVTTSEWGFRARAGLANMAEKTLDVQYYIWEADTTGKILAERLLRAADRGVRVRMLLDDINTADSDFKFALMARHPNVEVRLFNPFAKRQSRLSEFLFNIDRLNYRMHNKAFIADNAVAIVGGRNIGDHYFGVHTDANFRDLDLGMVGPVVQEVSRSFDLFWNSEQAVPIAALTEQTSDEGGFQESKHRLYRWVADYADFPYPVQISSEELFRKFAEFRDNNFVWATPKVLYDAPDKLETEEEAVADRLRQKGKSKKHEILLEVAYLVPGPHELASARSNRDKGIRQRILTNSLATNDVAAAHAGYARYRKQLIKSGVELYELRPDADSIKKKWTLMAGRSRASLHTKAFVMDGEKVGIGSFNLDPRSISLNTEIVIVVDAPELAAQVVDYMDTGVLPENSYHVVLEPDEDWGGERLVWITTKDGKEVRYYSDPDVSLWRRINAWFMSLLPIEKHL